MFLYLFTKILSFCAQKNSSLSLEKANFSSKNFRDNFTSVARYHRGSQWQYFSTLGPGGNDYFEFPSGNAGTVWYNGDE